jgi:hypothetical protein
MDKPLVPAAKTRAVPALLFMGVPRARPALHTWIDSLGGRAPRPVGLPRVHRVYGSVLRTSMSAVKNYNPACAILCVVQFLPDAPHHVLQPGD